MCIQGSTQTRALPPCLLDVSTKATLCQRIMTSLSFLVSLRIFGFTCSMPNRITCIFPRRRGRCPLPVHCYSTLYLPDCLSKYAKSQRFPPVRILQCDWPKLPLFRSSFASGKILVPRMDGWCHTRNFHRTSTGNGPIFHRKPKNGWSHKFEAEDLMWFS